MRSSPAFVATLAYSRSSLRVHTNRSVNNVDSNGNMNVNIHPNGRKMTSKIFGTKGESEQDESSSEETSEQQEEERVFLLQELERIESLTSLDDDAEDDFADLFDEGFGFSSLSPDKKDLEQIERANIGDSPLTERSADALQQALLQGVVPANAGVGSDCLAGDFGFDPLQLASKDYIGNMQQSIWRLLPTQPQINKDYENTHTHTQTYTDRPSALVLRDYREAEIRHGRLAMLAAILWPLQEMLDRLLLENSQLGSIVDNLFNNGITLPFIPLFMTAMILLLGYLDVYSQATKDLDDIGEAFMPGDCFWDPLRILDGAPDSMKRNMQERELFNGRMAMLAIAMFFFEEATTHLPLIDIQGNELLFEPAYEVPFIQSWLDSQFQTPSSVFGFPEMPQSY